MRLVEHLPAPVEDVLQLDARAVAARRGGRPHGDEAPQLRAAARDGYPGRARPAPPSGLLVGADGDAADRLDGHRAERGAALEARHLAAPEVDAHDLVLSAALGQEAERDVALGVALGELGGDDRRHRRVGDERAALERAADLALRLHDLQRRLQLLLADRRLLGGLGDRDLSLALDRPLDHERSLACVVVDGGLYASRLHRLARLALGLDEAEREQAARGTVQPLADGRVASEPVGGAGHERRGGPEALDLDGQPLGRRRHDDLLSDGAADATTGGAHVSSRARW